MAEKQELGPLQKEWLKALRSGGFEQCEGHLQQRDPQTKRSSYCCLGVACEVMMGMGMEIPRPDGKLEQKVLAGPAQPVKKALRLHSDGGGFRKDGKFHTELVPARHKDGGYLTMSASSLTMLNDSISYNFKDIAAFIENNPELIFEGPA